jgi:hypothetical protein
MTYTRTSVTRRATLGSLAISSLLVASNPLAAASSADLPLLTLGRDFDTLAASSIMLSLLESNSMTSFQSG